MGTSPAPRGVPLSELLLGLLPAVLALSLTAAAFSPALQLYTDPSRSFTLAAYIRLHARINTYLLAELKRSGTPQQRETLRQYVLSSLENPTEFASLAQVEQAGDVSLAQVRRSFGAGGAARAQVALDESLQLYNQSSLVLEDFRQRIIEGLRFLRWVTLLGALLSGGLSMALLLRSLLLRRAEQQRYAQQAEQQQERQRELLALASHELRRPLQHLLLASDLLREAATPQEQARLLRAIEENALRLAQRADLEGLSAAYGPEELQQLLPQDIGALLLPYAGPGVAVQLPAAPCVWPVDAPRFQQIIENLLDNAQKYAPGPVELCLEACSAGPTLTVRDYGPGLSPAWREQVFMAGQRGPLPSSASGQGLGLTVARRLAQAHGGTLELQAAKGGGLLARLTLRPAALPRPVGGP